MNEKNTIKELLAQLRNSEHWVKEIAAAWLGCEPDQVEITMKRNTEFNKNSTPLQKAELQ